MRKLTEVKPLRLFLGLLLALCVVGAAMAQDQPRIIAVNYPLQYFAERLAGDDAEVIFPVPSDVDPSFWRPAISDISMIQAADLILLNGAGFAAWVDRVSLPRARLVNTTAALEDQFIVTETITHSHGDGGEHSHEGLASYTWLDPTLAIGQAEAIASALTRRNLVDANDMEARLGALRADLEALDEKAREALAAFADAPMITTHPRYQYFARRYGLSVSALEWEAGAMPSGSDIDALRKLVEQTGARILVWEAEPPADAFASVVELGLINVVFSPMARSNPNEDYLRAMETALMALSQAASELLEN